MEYPDIKLETKVYRYREKRICVISAIGYLDISTIGNFKKIIDAIKIRGLYNLVIDFGKVEYVTSSGWGLFLGELKEFHQKGGDIRFSNMNPNVLNIFKLLELDTLIYYYNDLREAISSFPQNPQPKYYGDYSGEKNNPAAQEKGQDVIREYRIKLRKLEEERKILEREKTLLAYEKEKISKAWKEIEQRRRELEIERKAIENSLKNKDHIRLSHETLIKAIKDIVIRRPEYGATRIRNELLAKKISNKSRSTIYRTLRNLDLNTKAKRIRFKLTVDSETKRKSYESKENM